MIRPLIILLLSATTGLSQTRHIDSVKQVYEHSTGLKRADAAYELTFQLMATDKKQALYYAQKIEPIALAAGDSMRIVEGMLSVGYAFQKLEQYDEALPKLKSALLISERNNFISKIKFLTNCLGGINALKGNYEEALHYHFQSLALREQDQNKFDISISLNNIGLIYYKVRNYNQALEYYKKSYIMKTENNIAHDVPLLLINMGLCYNQLKDFKKARESFHTALDYCSSNCTDLTRMQATFGFGVSYYLSSDYRKATTYIDSSYNLAVNLSEIRYQGDNLVYLGKIGIAKKEYDKAVESLRKAEVIASEGGYRELLIDVYRQSLILYTANGNLTKASEYQNKYISLKDSVYNELLFGHLVKYQSDFEKRENMATIKLKEEALSRQRKLNMSIVAITVLFGLLIFVLYRSIHSSRRKNTAINEAKGIIEIQNEKLQLMNQRLEQKVKEKSEIIEQIEQSEDDLDRVNNENSKN